MGIFRVEKKDNYVVLDKVFLNDKRLSWQAKGLLAYMLSMPNDWVFRIEDLKNRSSNGRDSTKSIIKELQQYGYIIKEQERQQGKFSNNRYIVLERPTSPLTENPSTENPSTENPSTENPSTENPQLLNNKELNNNLLSNKEINDDDIGKPNPFVEFEQAFGYLTPTLLDEFNHWIDNSQFIEPEAIICEVIKRARMQMPRNPSSYVSKILKELHRLELFTLDAVKEYNEKFDRKTKQRTGKSKVLVTEKHGRDIPDDFVFDINAGEDWQ